jgi:hypothetical protein
MQDERDTNRLTPDARERKRARFAGAPSAAPAGKRAALAGAGVLAVLAAAVALYATTATNRSSEEAPVRPATASTAPASKPAAAGPQVIEADGAVFRIPAATVTASASFFKASFGERTVSFFAVRDSAGQPVVALDACAVCAHAKKGYAQRGDQMLCRNCGLTFPVNGLAAMGDKGGCHPITLPFRIEGGAILVDRKAVEGGGKYF